MVKAWEEEIIECGDLVQDDDESVPPEEAERRWNRYVELADAVTGAEGAGGVAALVSSLTAVEDYGAHQAVHDALSRFPATDLGSGVVRAGAKLLEIPENNGGNVLLLLCRSGEDSVTAFNNAALAIDADTKAALLGLIEHHESEEWLSAEKDRGRLLMPRVAYR
ncbi:MULTISPECIES: hypothetical protein [Streptomyces]|uniref:hypothetical protein n=1 Tax=Streptomyces TaxID=1883 RepID=UPI00117CAFDF|nr:hypothetical protein [Streptomyces kasugaensis]